VVPAARRGGWRLFLDEPTAVHGPVVNDIPFVVDKGGRSVPHELVGVVVALEDKLQVMTVWCQQHELGVSMIEMDREAVGGIDVVAVAGWGDGGVGEGEDRGETRPERFDRCGLPGSAGELGFEILDGRSVMALVFVSK